MTKIAILIFDRLTALDAVGPYEVLSRLPDAEVKFVGQARTPIRTDTGFLGIEADATLDEVTSADILLVPGGPGQGDLMDDKPLHEWLRRIDETTTYTTSVCTGSLLLTAAGILENKKATTHWAFMNQLKELGATPTEKRVVKDGKYLTAAGVSSGIDMALTLASEVAGQLYAETIQLGIEYNPEPPFNAGSPKTAPKEAVTLLSQMS